MARAPETHHIVHRTVRRQAERERQSLSADRRGTAAERGYDSRWQRRRVGFIRKHPLCCCCEANGVVEPTALVDHIVPHEGDKTLFWERDNWQPLCDRCHRVIKAKLERRWKLGEVDARHLRLDYAMPAEYLRVKAGWMEWHPDDLGPSRIPLTIVCGPPCAGKSRWVDERAGADDLVIDMDRIAAEMCGTGMHDWPQERLNEIGQERNNRLRWLCGPRAAKWHAAWFIVGEPRPEWRAWWDVTMRPKSIVVIEALRDACLSRATAERPNPQQTCSAIETWWRAYARRSDDVVVTG